VFDHVCTYSCTQLYVHTIFVVHCNVHSAYILFNKSFLSVLLIHHSYTHANSYSVLFDVIEYVYSLHVNGSIGSLFIFHNCLNGSSQNVHCCHTSHHEYVIGNQFVGSGYFHVFVMNNSKLVCIFHKSVVLTLSLAFLLYHCIDRKAIVHNIDSIVITTISSTNVKAEIVFFIGMFLGYKVGYVIPLTPLN